MKGINKRMRDDLLRLVFRGSFESPEMLGVFVAHLNLTFVTVVLVVFYQVVICIVSSYS